MTSWLAILAVVAGGIALYDNRAAVIKELSPLLSKERSVAAKEAAVAALESWNRARTENALSAVGLGEADLDVRVVVEIEHALEDEALGSLPDPLGAAASPREEADGIDIPDSMEKLSRATG